MAGPWEKYGQATAPAAPAADPIIKAADPYRAEDQQMQREANARAAAAADRQAAADERAAATAERQAAKDAAGTEAEKKIATLVTRIAGGFSDIQGITAGDPSAQEPGIVESMRGGLDPNGLTGIPARAIAGANRRTVHDAQRDVLDALLTLGTGAAYNAEQLTGAMASHFPQYNDTPEEIAIKNQRLLRLIEAAKANAGPAWANVEPAIAPYMQKLAAPTEQDNGAGGAPAGEVLIGYGKNEDGSPYPIYGKPGTSPYGGGNPPGSGFDPNGFGGLVELGKQGITLGLADEAAGVGGAIGAGLTGNDPAAAYTRERDLARQNVAAARQAWPVLGTATELLGGGGAARAALTVPNTLARVARQGAGMGGIAGFGYGEGGDSVPNALLGAATGGVLGAGLYGAGAGINALARRKTPNVDMEVVQAGQRQNIPVRQPDARPELRGKYAAAESTTNGGPMIRQAREADAAAMEQRVAEVGGQGNPSDPYALGTRVQQAGERYIARTKQQANRLYDRARQKAGNTAVTPRNADAALDANIQELRAAGENSNAAAIKYLEGLRSDIDRGLSLDAVQNLRTNMRGQISQQGLTGTDTERRVGQVLDAMNQDLAEQLPKEAAQALKAADAFYKERQTFINDTLKQFMGSRGNPLPAETAAQRVVSMAQGKGNYERFSRMWSQLEPGEQADVAATVAASLGRARNGDFSPAMLVKSLDPRQGINPRTAALIFGKDGAAALQDLRVLASAKTATMARQSPSGVAVNAAAGGLKTLLMSALGFSTGGPAGAVAGGAARELLAKWGEQRAARMLLNPDFTKWLRNAPNTTNPRAIDRYFAKLGTIGSIAANDNAAFVGAVRQVFAGSPGAAAAQNEQDPGQKPPQ